MSDVRRVINSGRGQAPLAAAEEGRIAAIAPKTSCHQNRRGSRKATDRQVSREAATVPALLIGRNNGPASIPAASSHARSAFTAGLGATEIAKRLGLGRARCIGPQDIVVPGSQG